MNANSGFDYHPVTITTNLPHFDSVYLFVVTSYSNYYRTVNKNYDECIVWCSMNDYWAIPSPHTKKKIAKLLGIIFK
ncbi:MAG TPA: hypothetical protein VMU83_15990 [Hanamia sp.]|nr:hypothetical protein [Hanamia sp.]